MPIDRRLRRLERRVGLGQPAPDDGAEYALIPVEEYAETNRDMTEIQAGWAGINAHWRRAYEEWLPYFEAAEAEAAAVGPGGMIRRRRLSDEAELKLDKLLEKLRRDRDPMLDAARAERRARRAPWPAPWSPPPLPELEERV
jgi:hypothetical protein